MAVQTWSEGGFLHGSGTSTVSVLGHFGPFLAERCNLGKNREKYGSRQIITR